MHILTLKETASILTISRSTLYLLIKSGDIKTFNITEKRVGILRTEINRYVAAKNDNNS